MRWQHRALVGLGGLFLLIPPCAWAGDGPAPPHAPASGLPAERSGEFIHVRADLDRLNGEIARLKQSSRSLSQEYRLRDKMAEAESLARRLTEMERQQERGKGKAVSGAAGFDGPVEWEAQADLLADQSNHLIKQATQMAQSAEQIRGRQLLRRRVNQLDRDPFASLDASRRSLVIAGNAARPSDSAGAGTTLGGSSGGAAMSPPAPGRGAAESTATKGAAPASGNASPAVTAPAAAPQADAPAPPQASPPLTPSAPPIVLQLRALLDPQTLAEVRRVEAGGAPPTDPEALERLAAGLQARAKELAAQAAALRSQARRP